MVSPDSVQMSREFFEDPSSYARFTLTPDHRSVVGCIEPRDAESTPPGEYDTVVQTSGGAAGEGLDNALAQTIVGGEVVSVEAGMEADGQQRPLTVFGAHHDCTFIKKLVNVTGEMAAPSDFTRESVGRWAQYFDLRDHVEHTLGQVADAAAVQIDYLEQQEHMAHLVERADELYPEHNNVVHVRGVNIARVYVMGMHPHVGKNRNAKPRDPELAAQVQGYHDSLAASVRNLRDESGISNEVRGLRLTSMLLRAAAARTTITTPILPEMSFYEVRPADTPSGLAIVEEMIG